MNAECEQQQMYVQTCYTRARCSGSGVAHRANALDRAIEAKSKGTLHLESGAPARRSAPVSYTHLTLPTICSV
eukprot:862418-Alexandrium_andersonii.AAC.1